MKRGRDIAFQGIASEHDAVRLVLRIRFAECLEKQGALAGGDDEALHAFRLACKRLRYAIERFDVAAAQFAGAAEALARIADELGSAHDCTVLARRAERCNAAAVRRRALTDSSAYRKRAKRLWEKAFAPRGAFAPLAAESGFTWRTT